MSSMENKTNDCRKQTAIVLPSLDPDSKFEKVVMGLVENGFQQIVIVDDGSAPDRQVWFRNAEAYPECTVLHHEGNKGKGRGLKTAFAYVLSHYPDLKGVITIDGDGQHLVEDIIACGNQMLDHPDRVVLGCRDFNLPNVPPRSVTGNKFTSRMFRLLFGIQLSDTQTGLRAIPSCYLKQFCEIGGERFEYETNMLLQMKRDGISFIEQPIATIYDPEDYSSHYNALKDSWKVGKVMLKFLVTGTGFKFLLSSICAFLIDNAVYYALLALLGIGARRYVYAIARVVSSFCNFNINRFMVFRTMDRYGKELLRYYCLAVPQALISFLFVNLTQNLAHVTSPVIATLLKILVEGVIFFLSYFIQKKWVYRKK